MAKKQNRNQKSVTLNLGALSVSKKWLNKAVGSWLLEAVFDKYLCRVTKTERDVLLDYVDTTCYGEHSVPKDVLDAIHDQDKVRFVEGVVQNMSTDNDKVFLLADIMNEHDWSLNKQQGKFIQEFVSTHAIEGTDIEGKFLGLAKAWGETEKEKDKAQEVKTHKRRVKEAVKLLKATGYKVQKVSKDVVDLTETSFDPTKCQEFPTTATKKSKQAKGSVK